MARRSNAMQLITAQAHSADSTVDGVLRIDNTVDPRTLALDGVRRVDLQFPKFTDGRAFSQAFLLRRRLGFAGQIRAIGDVLIDQLAQMQRTGFTQAVLRADQSIDHGRQLLAQYDAYYQGDAVDTRPHFAAA
jgi:uncharacterized protein (DUF934 family)